jgi:UDP-N-acetylmuramoylalanine--D-glutamate ligase
MEPIELHGRNVVVMGLGRFGGGIGVARWLCERGAKVTVTDLASADVLADSVRQLSGLTLTFHLGGHDEADLDGCDLLVVSPAVPKDRSDFVQKALSRRTPLSSEMNLFAERCPARRVIGVTGSAGKSTTTAMIGSTLTEAASAGSRTRGSAGTSDTRCSAISMR